MPVTFDVTFIEDFAETELLIQITKPSPNMTQTANSSSGSEPWSLDFFWALKLFYNLLY